MRFANFYLFDSKCGLLFQGSLQHKSHLESSYTIYARYPSDKWDMQLYMREIEITQLMNLLYSSLLVSNLDALEPVLFAMFCSLKQKHLLTSYPPGNWNIHTYPTFGGPGTSPSNVPFFRGHVSLLGGYIFDHDGLSPCPKPPGDYGPPIVSPPTLAPNM